MVNGLYLYNAFLSYQYTQRALHCNNKTTIKIMQYLYVQVTMNIKVNGKKYINSLAVLIVCPQLFMVCVHAGSSYGLKAVPAKIAAQFLSPIVEQRG